MQKLKPFSRQIMQYGLAALVGGILFTGTPLQAQSLQLNGDLDYATIDDVAGSTDPADNLDVSDNTFSLELWVKHDGNSDDNARLIDKTQGNSADPGYEVHFVGSGEQPRVRLNLPNTFTAVTSNQGIPAGRWTHLAFTYDGSEMAIYINGEKDATSSENQDVEGNDLPFVVGANTGKNGQFFSGQIDNIRLWGDKRELIEIQNNLYKSLSGNENGLVAYYPFDNLSNNSNTVTDATGNADLTLQGDYVATGNVFPLPPDLYVLDEGNSEIDLELRPRIDASNNSAASRYVLYRADVLDSSFTALDTLNRSNGLQYTDTGVSNGLTYLYRAAAVNANISSAADFSYRVTAGPRFATETVEAANGGTALGLDGENDYAIIPDNKSPSMDFKDSTFTLELWVRHDGNSDNNARLIDKTQGSASSGGYEVHFVDEGEQPRVKLSVPNTFTGVTSNQGIPANRWTHLAFTYDGSEMALYINGVKDATSSENQDVEGNDLPFVIGANTGTNDEFFSGRIDELALWDDARTQSEVQQTYRQPLKGYESDLKAYWHFNDVVPGPKDQTNSRRTLQLKEDAEVTSGGAFPLAPIMHARVLEDTIEVNLASRYPSSTQDSVGIYRRNSTNGNASLITKIEGGTDTSLETTLPLSPGTSQPDSSFFLQATSFNSQRQESDLGSPVLLANKTKLGNSLTLDGNSDFGYVPDNNNPSLDIRDNTMSLEAWVRYNDSSNQESVIVDKTDGSATTGGFELGLQNVTVDSAQPYINAPGTFSTVEANSYIEADAWHHLAFTYDGNTLTLYINGQKQGEVDDSRNIEGNGLPLVIGANTSTANSNFFSGEVDELRLWDDARTQIEIQNNYQQELVGNEQGLKSYWRFNGTPGDTTAYTQRGRLRTMGLRGDAAFLDESVFTGVDQVAQDAKRGYQLMNNAPNPFTSQTAVRYTLPERTRVTLTVYNLRGERVTQLVNRTQSAGTYEASFRPAGLSNGVYLYRLETPAYQQTKRMMLLR